MLPWLELVGQVVVVDSLSTDGTVEFLQKEIRHPNFRIISHPPGLYRSWNAGISELTTDYAYISTVGDTIERNGLVEMVNSIKRLGADVIISPPAFLRENGTSTTGPRWPVHAMIREMHLEQPTLIPQLAIVAYVLAYPEGALLGSCASCVFRTATLQRLPFPVDVGVAGDGVWGWKHSAEIRWAVDPACRSTFLIHPTAASKEDRERSRGGFRADRVIAERLPAWLAAKVVDENQWKAAGLKDLLEEARQYAECKIEFDLWRRRKSPWILNPKAWTARLRRNRIRKRLRRRVGFSVKALSPLLNYEKP